MHAPDDEALQARLGAFIARELGGKEDEERHLGCAKYRLPVEHQVDPPPPSWLLVDQRQVLSDGVVSHM